MVSKEEVVTEAKEAAELLVSQAEDIMTEAKEKAIQMIQDAKDNASRIEKEAEENANKIESDAEYKAQAKMDAAKKWSNDLKYNASNYVDELIAETEYRIAKSLNEVQTLQDNLKAAARMAQQTNQRADKGKGKNTKKQKR